MYFSIRMFENWLIEAHETDKSIVDVSTYHFREICTQKMLNFNYNQYKIWHANFQKQKHWIRNEKSIGGLSW